MRKTGTMTGVALAALLAWCGPAAADGHTEFEASTNCKPDPVAKEGTDSVTPGQGVLTVTAPSGCAFWVKVDLSPLMYFDGAPMKDLVLRNNNTEFTVPYNLPADKPLCLTYEFYMALPSAPNGKLGHGHGGICNY